LGPWKPAKSIRKRGRFVLLSDAGIVGRGLARKSFPLNPLDIIAATGNPIVFLLLLFILTIGGSFCGVLLVPGRPSEC
jgi:hypothetical protein